jgi:hypothetical protein
MNPSIVSQYSPEQLLLALGAGGLVSLLCLIGGFFCLKRKRLIDDIPTSKTQGVFIGLVELKGTAQSESPLHSYLAEVACVHYHWQVDEHWSRTVTETYTDSKGNRKTRTRRESGWTTVAEGGEMKPFYLQDDTGVIQVVPEGAKIEPSSFFSQTCTQFDPLYYQKGPAGAIADSDHRRRFVEEGIPLQASLYVMGHARERQDVVAPEIAKDTNESMFIISTRTEKEIRSGYAGLQWFWMLVSLAAACGGVFAFHRMTGQNPAQHAIGYVLAAVLWLVALGLGWVWLVFNSLVGLRQRVRQAWAQVDVQLKRRNDLIPNLVQTVQGYRQHEQDTQTFLSELRAQLAATPPGEEGADFRGCTPALFALAEKYPELKANESFLNLQRNLTDTEQRIALARSYFNDIATFYNNRLQIIPDRFVVPLGHFQPQVLMVASDFERAPVQVNLAVETSPTQPS